MADHLFSRLCYLLCRTSWWTWPKRWPTPRPCWCWKPRTWPRLRRILCSRTGSLPLPPSVPCPPPSWWRVPRYGSMAVGHLNEREMSCFTYCTKRLTSICQYLYHMHSILSWGGVMFFHLLCHICLWFEYYTCGGVRISLGKLLLKLFGWVHDNNFPNCCFLISHK